MEQLFFIRLNNQKRFMQRNFEKKKKQNNSLRIYFYTYTYTSIEVYQNCFYIKDDLLFLLIL
jgi:hypothetical protein